MQIIKRRHLVYKPVMTKNKVEHYLLHLLRLDFTRDLLRLPSKISIIHWQVQFIWSAKWINPLLFQEMLNMLSNDNDDSNTDNEEEDFSTLRHECLAIVLKSSTRVSGICLWRKDKTIQYFSSAIPNCCLHNACASKGRLIFYPLTVYENSLI